MTIIKLILHKYKRFMFINNITTLVYTPETNTQIILGSNGCGKSSLLSMLNPLPADKKDFDTDGIQVNAISRDASTDGGTEEPSFAISFDGGGDIDLSNLKDIVCILPEVSSIDAVEFKRFATCPSVKP